MLLLEVRSCLARFLLLNHHLGQLSSTSLGYSTRCYQCQQMIDSSSLLDLEKASLLASDVAVDSASTLLPSTIPPSPEAAKRRCSTKDVIVWLAVVGLLVYVCIDACKRKGIQIEKVSSSLAC